MPDLFLVQFISFHVVVGNLILSVAANAKGDNIVARCRGFAAKLEPPKVRVQFLFIQIVCGLIFSEQPNKFHAKIRGVLNENASGVVNLNEHRGGRERGEQR